MQPGIGSPHGAPRHTEGAERVGMGAPARAASLLQALQLGLAVRARAAEQLIASRLGLLLHKVLDGEAQLERGPASPRPHRLVEHIAVLRGRRAGRQAQQR